MNRGARPQHIVWQHFDKVEKDGKQCVKFFNCGIIRSNRMDRMKTTCFRSAIAVDEPVDA